jgi:hypothetical protein
MNATGQSVPAIPAGTQGADLVVAINDRIRRLTVQTVAVATAAATVVQQAGGSPMSIAATPPPAPSLGQQWLDISDSGNSVLKTWQMVQGVAQWVV